MFLMDSIPMPLNKVTLYVYTEIPLFNNVILTLISVLGWSINTISDSSPSSKMLTVFSPNSSSEKYGKN